MTGKTLMSLKKRVVLIFFCVLCGGMTGCRRGETEFQKEIEIENEITPEKEKENQDEKVSQKKFSPSPPEITEKPEETKIYVDVCGAVTSPGVICISEGSRVFQAIEAAGGFLPEAARNYVNCAQSLSDGEKLYIPTQEEAEEWGLQQGSSVQETQKPIPENASSNEAAESKVNLNTADETQLCTLSGIGLSKAKAIIAYREQNGSFGSVEELMNVEGIKEGTFSKIKDQIVVK